MSPEDIMMLIILVVGIFAIVVCIYMWRLEIKQERESRDGFSNHRWFMHPDPDQPLSKEVPNEPLAAGEPK